jgi:hypothetical protein
MDGVGRQRNQVWAERTGLGDNSVIRDAVSSWPDPLRAGKDLRYHHRRGSSGGGVLCWRQASR